MVHPWWSKISGVHCMRYFFKSRSNSTSTVLLGTQFSCASSRWLETIDTANIPNSNSKIFSEGRYDYNQLQNHVQMLYQYHVYHRNTIVYRDQYPSRRCLLKVCMLLKLCLYTYFTKSSTVFIYFINVLKILRNQLKIKDVKCCKICMWFANNGIS